MIINIINIIKKRFVSPPAGPTAEGNTSDGVRTHSSEVEEFGGGVVLAPICPKCQSKEVYRRGFRKKKLEKIQLFQCKNCGATFTPQFTKGKHYPLEVILDAMSFYNLGYSLEEVCEKINSGNKKSRFNRDSCDLTLVGSDRTFHPSNNIPHKNDFVKDQNQVEVAGVAPARSWMKSPISHSSTPTDKLLHEENLLSMPDLNLKPSTLAAWMKEFSGLCRYSRMRDFAIKLFSPEDAIVTATLAHRQLYRFRFHRAKCRLLMQEHFKHSQFGALKEFLELVPCECPHQYFQSEEEHLRGVAERLLGGEKQCYKKYAGLRASEAPLAFSKTAMIVRSKSNFANQLTAFVLQTVKENKRRHEALQKFMFYNDSVTVATEVPVYLMREDLLHMKSQLGFQIYRRAEFLHRRHCERSEAISNGIAAAASRPRNDSSNPLPKLSDISEAKSLPMVAEMADTSLPSLITGHIDILQIRNGMIHILDYKPNAAKERPIEQLTLYAMALSRLTGLRLFEFKCAWFDEKDYFEFYPLHVLHKPKKAIRRKKVETIEGTYTINKNEKKIENLRPVL